MCARTTCFVEFAKFILCARLPCPSEGWRHFVYFEYYFWLRAYHRVPCVPTRRNKLINKKCWERKRKQFSNNPNPNEYSECTNNDDNDGINDDNRFGRCRCIGRFCTRNVNRPNSHWNYRRKVYLLSFLLFAIFPFSHSERRQQPPTNHSTYLYMKKFDPWTSNTHLFLCSSKLISCVRDIASSLRSAIPCPWYPAHVPIHQFIDFNLRQSQYYVCGFVAGAHRVD